LKRDERSLSKTDHHVEKQIEEVPFPQEHLVQVGKNILVSEEGGKGFSFLKGGK